MWWRAIILSGLFLGTILAAIPHLIWLVSFIAGKLAHFRVPYAPFGWTALALVLILWATLFYGNQFGMWQKEVTQVEYAHKDMPKSFDGYRIVHISDLHLDTFDENPEKLDEVVTLINEQKPDLILFTGDMVTGRFESVSEHKEALRRLQAKDGVMSVLGNHDFFIYDRNLKNNAERMARASKLASIEASIGWHVLRNRHEVLTRGNDSICIAGVDNINGNQGFRTIQCGDLKAALNGSDGMFTVLLSHDPSHWTAEVLPKSQVHVTLSGHTHAGQVRLFGWSLSSIAFKECDGRYDSDGRMLYVNAGIGCTAPVRIGCPSEITVITLHSQQKN